MERLQDHFSAGSANRVADAIFLYAEQESKLKINNPRESNRDLYNIELKLDYFRGIAKEYRKSKNKTEKQSLRYVRHEIRRLKGKLNPNIFNRIYYSDLAEFLKTLLRGKTDPVNYYQKAIKSLDKDLIQNHNLQYLSAELKKVGFKAEMEGALKRMINQNLSSFHLRYADVENHNAHYVLHFKKIPQTDLYYFEKFDAISRPSLDALLNNDVNCSRQTFHVHDELKINASEAAHLVNGKSICRNIDGRDQWLMVDNVYIKSPLKTIEFDLESNLALLPIQEKDNQIKYQAIIDALKQGATKEVTLISDREPTKYYLEASPQNNVINVLDKNRRLVDLDMQERVKQRTNSVFAQVKEQELNYNHKEGMRVR